MFSLFSLWLTIINSTIVLYYTVITDYNMVTSPTYSLRIKKKKDYIVQTKSK